MLDLDLVKRLVKGTPLTASDYDDNLQKVQDGINTLSYRTTNTALTTATNYTIVSTNIRLVLVDSTLGNTTITLPEPSADYEVTISKTVSDNLVTISTPSGSILGNPSVSLKYQYTTIKLISDGTNYYII